ncbi:MAG: YbaB/EbfC family nucleoid-associated protein [Stackebrandtia sp.]
MADSNVAKLTRHLAAHGVSLTRAALTDDPSGMRRRLDETQFHVDSPDGLVRAYMTGSGMLNDVRLRPGAMRRLSPAELARSVSAVIARCESVLDEALAGLRKPSGAADARS